jgi:aminopeptidase N
VELRIAYSGAPRVAPNAPWDGGVSWERTPSGAPWIATSCQTLGADVWWPMKDHPSDEPDSMDIAVTVPHPLRTASNGVLRDVSTTDSTRTDRWHVSTSINPYTVALNIAPYARLDTTHTSPDGVSFPVSFYALPSDSARAQTALPHFLEHVTFLEETLAPYPFRQDKYGIAQTPFLGMEHQTIIAYGNNFRLNGGLGYSAGFDALHFHELAHEWFGNCLTVRDWKDFWLHEGFATYTEALYAEHLRGASGYREVIQHNASRFGGGTAIARVEPTSAQSIYNGDVYFKGALVLHTLRYVLGDDDFFAVLRRFVTGSASSDDATCRHVTTADFVHVAEDVSGRQLDGFFSVYLYQPTLPRLASRRDDERLSLRWERTDGAPFQVPVPVEVEGTVQRVEMEDGTGTLPLAPDAEVTIDPEGWLLRDSR